jgi:4-hydroxybenzoate polyprenyltransferase
MDKKARNEGFESSPLVVDLDGTLIRTDILAESFFALLKRNILYAFLIPVWLFKGKAHLKYQIAQRVDMDVTSLPYHEEFLNFLRQEHRNGRKLILATASNEKFASAIALSLGIFDEVLASNAKVNLSGRRKLQKIRELCGENGFDYAANAMVDVPIWEASDNAILVNPENGVETATKKISQIQKVFDDRYGSVLRRYLKALRLHQWLKNALIFVPLLMAHRFDEPLLVGQAALAFLAFGLCASSVYLLNDLLDLPDDRQHPTKRNRPFAAGSISIVWGAFLIPGLLIAAFSLALMLPVEFVGVLGFYYAMTMAYSFKLKRAAPMDVLTLAGLYTLRIIAGAAAVSVAPSFWLLAFSMFLFLSLALVKRYTELLSMQQQKKTKSSGRGYTTVDLETLSQFGSASAYMAILVLALYINSESVIDLYRHPELIWLLCPLLLYLVMRIWLLARRDQVHEDPVVFVIEDRRSQVVVGLGAVLLWLAI